MVSIAYVGADNLPRGWHRPTSGLLDHWEMAVNAGIAPWPTLVSRTKAQPLGTKSSPQINRGKALLLDLVGPNHELRALGMTYNQLVVAASTGPLSMFSAIIDLQGLTAADRRPGKLFLDPVVIPDYEQGLGEPGIEPCFSTIGLIPEVPRFKSIKLESANHPTYILEGPGSTVAQHEDGHNRGELAVDLAYTLRLPVYYVPPELKPTFLEEYHRKGRRHEWPHRFVQGQWEAWCSRRYSPLNYA